MTAIPPDIVNAEWDGPTFRRAGEVMLIYFEWLSAPGASLVSEVANELLLLGIDADNGQPVRSERRPLCSDVPELLISVGVLRASSSFLVRPECEAHVLEKLADGAMVDPKALLAKRISQLPQATANPQRPTHWVASDLSCEQPI
jgi:hypothetical protein